MAACNGITIMSSLNRNGLSTKNSLTWCATEFSNHCGPYLVRVAASPPSTVITWVGFCRNWNAPCGPAEPKSAPRANTLPCFTRDAASATLSAVMKFSVPSSSASPHRPQLQTSWATRRKSVILAGIQLSCVARVDSIRAVSRWAMMPPSAQITCPVT